MRKTWPTAHRGATQPSDESAATRELFPGRTCLEEGPPTPRSGRSLHPRNEPGANQASAPEQLLGFSGQHNAHFGASFERVRVENVFPGSRALRVQLPWMASTRANDSWRPNTHHFRWSCGASAGPVVEQSWPGTSPSHPWKVFVQGDLRPGTSGQVTGIQGDVWDAAWTSHFGDRRASTTPSGWPHLPGRGTVWAVRFATSKIYRTPTSSSPLGGGESGTCSGTGEAAPGRHRDLQRAAVRLDLQPDGGELGCFTGLSGRTTDAARSIHRPDAYSPRRDRCPASSYADLDFSIVDFKLSRSGGPGGPTSPVDSAASAGSSGRCGFVYSRDVNGVY